MLSLELNKLTSLPDEISNLKKLENLNLSRNKLKNVPASIGELEKLEYLFLNEKINKSTKRNI